MKEFSDLFIFILFNLFIFCLRTGQSKITIYKKMGRKKGSKIEIFCSGQKIFKQLEEGTRQVILY